MKRKLVLLFTLALVAPACSDDDGPTPEQQLSRVYRDQELALRMNGETVTDKTVALSTTDLKQAAITFNYLIPGESPLLFDKVALQPVSGKPGTYSFSGESRDADRGITFTGSVGKTMEVDVSYESSSKAVGLWTLPSEGVLQVKVTPVSPEAKVNMFGMLFMQETLVTGGVNSMDDFIYFLGSMFGTMLELELDLYENGGVKARWASTSEAIPIEPGESPAGIARYNVYQNRLFASIALEKLFASASRAEISPESIETLYGIARQIYMGLPLHVSFPDDSTLRFMVDKEMMLPYLPIVIPLLCDLIKDVDMPPIAAMFGITGEALAGFIGEVGRVIRESPEFEFHFVLSRKASTGRTLFTGASDRLEMMLRNDVSQN